MHTAVVVWCNRITYLQVLIADTDVERTLGSQDFTSRRQLYALCFESIGAERERTEMLLSTPCDYWTPALPFYSASFFKLQTDRHEPSRWRMACGRPKCHLRLSYGKP